MPLLQLLDFILSFFDILIEICDVLFEASDILFMHWYLILSNLPVTLGLW